jgi:hypothetical protein
MGRFYCLTEKNKSPPHHIFEEKKIQIYCQIKVFKHAGDVDEF